MTPEELFEAVKTAVIQKEINLVQGDWGVLPKDGIWELEREDKCACVFGVLLAGEEKLSDHIVNDIEHRFGFRLRTDSIVEGFDNYPLESQDKYPIDEWVEVGFRIAEWADENGFLKKYSPAPNDV